ncbi:hypothetical protein PIB30_013868 [Stylosanthes scabra]|uniref:Replication factor A C-terminal domain-containing protein n=1 Tax=Stylosanthes scabra TaxID=79078 RepID=A0ABU6U5B8_9FABA|nr:hypothetical protein [Stylosanthes scabra]
MVPTEHFLADVHTRTPEWVFDVYVVRLWEVPTKKNPKEMSDVVAHVVGREDPRNMLSKTGKELKRMVIIIENIGKNRINCALFEVHINPDLEEVVSYRESLMAGGTACSSKISHVSSQSAVSALEELTQPDVSVMKIEDAIKCDEECKPWIAGQIVALNNGMDDWYYHACGNCGKKVDPAPKGRYECTNDKCGHIGETPMFK